MQHTSIKRPSYLDALVRPSLHRMTAAYYYRGQAHAGPWIAEMWVGGEADGGATFVKRVERASEQAAKDFIAAGHNRVAVRTGMPRPAPKRVRERAFYMLRPIE